MTKAELVEDVARAAELTEKDAERLVEIVFESIIETLNQGEKIELRGFGSFRVRERGARRGRNPKTGDPVSIPAKRVPYFKPSSRSGSRSFKCSVSGRPPRSCDLIVCPPFSSWRRPTRSRRGRSCPAPTTWRRRRAWRAAPDSRWNTSTNSRPIRSASSAPGSVTVRAPRYISSDRVDVHDAPPRRGGARTCRSTCVASFCLSKPWSTNTHVS